MSLEAETQREVAMIGDPACVEAAIEYHAVIRRELAIPDREMVICGMALGHADEAHPINRLVTERARVEEFATFEGFGD